MFACLLSLFIFRSTLVLGSYCLGISSGSVDSCWLELELLLVVPFAGACQAEAPGQGAVSPHGAGVSDLVSQCTDLHPSD